MSFEKVTKHTPIFDKRLCSMTSALSGLCGAQPQQDTIKDLLTAEQSELNYWSSP